MRIEVLGSGGAATTPRPGCDCRTCVEARDHGVPYARTGPSVFVHGPDLLIDTPEESNLQLNRAGIGRVPYALYSHWHPDHTGGRRVFETMNFDFRAWPPEPSTTEIYLPEQVAHDFDEYLGLAQHFRFMADAQGTVRVHVVPDGAAIEFGATRVMPLRLAEDGVYAFLLEGDGVRVLIAMDELNGWTPPDLGALDLAYLPIGIFEHHPFTGQRLIPEDHPVLPAEATYPETLEIARALGARRTVLGHVEEMNGLSHDELVRLGEQDGWEAAYDGLVLDPSRA